MRLRRLTPMLQTLDLAATIAWYERLLGFHCVARQGDEWCRLERDGVALMFMVNAHLGAPAATATQYFEVEDVEALFAALRGRATVEWGLEEMPYGMREFAIRDCSGYLLSFGEPTGERGFAAD